MTIDPNPDLVESLQKLFSKGGSLGVYAYSSGWMSAVIVRAAQEHAEFCASCRTCHDLSELLSAVAALQIINPPTDLPAALGDGGRPAADDDPPPPDAPAVDVQVGRLSLSLTVLVALAVVVLFVLAVR